MARFPKRLTVMQTSLKKPTPESLVPHTQRHYAIEGRPSSRASRDRIINASFPCVTAIRQATPCFESRSEALWCSPYLRVVSLNFRDGQMGNDRHNI